MNIGVEGQNQCCRIFCTIFCVSSYWTFLKTKYLIINRGYYSYRMFLFDRTRSKTLFIKIILRFSVHMRSILTYLYFVRINFRANSCREAKHAWKLNQKSNPREIFENWYHEKVKYKNLFQQRISRVSKMNWLWRTKIFKFPSARVREN